MRIPRIYIPVPLHSDTRLTLPDGAANHIVRVLRLRSGAPLLLFNGEGGEYEAVIERSGKREVSVRTGRFMEADRESPLQITLAQGISRGERMDFCLQKATELGVSRVVPLFTRRCNVQLDGERLERRMQHWRGVITAACEQSGRTRLPELLPARPLADWLQAPQDPAALKLVLHHRAHAAARAPGPADNVVMLIGPEGGLDENEISQALQSGYQPLSLGPRVLRTETAALAALAAVQALWGDFSRLRGG